MNRNFNLEDWLNDMIDPDYMELNKEQKEFIEKLEARNQFGEFQMHVIYLGFKNGLSMEQIEVYANPEFDVIQMSLILDGFENELSIDQVRQYAHPEFDAEQMEAIRHSLGKPLNNDEMSL